MAMKGNGGDGAYHTTRDCIRCGARLNSTGWCSTCETMSEIRLCAHLKPLPAYRVVARVRPREPGEVLAITVGDVCTFIDGAPTRLKETKLRAQMRDRRRAAVELGLDSFGAMALIATCQQCDRAFFLPDVPDRRRPPRIASVPLRERITVLLSSHADGNRRMRT